MIRTFAWVGFSAFLLFSASAGAEGITISKKQFVEEFNDKLPKVFCTSEKSYFRSCFEGTAEACKEVASKAVAGCVAEREAELPAEFHQPKDGQEWGKKIGDCAGTKFEAEKAKDLKATGECKDPTKWQ
jgi:hypothetical protein